MFDYFSILRQIRRFNQLICEKKTNLPKELLSTLSESSLQKSPQPSDTYLFLSP